MYWLITIAWSVPLAELLMLTAGHINYRCRFRTAPAGKFTELIIQVTTTGREHARVSEIIAQIRDYRLSMPYRIWVVTEPGQRTDYPQADRVLVVQLSFAPESKYKARALEWSRLVRAAQDLDRPDVKIMFCDDDVTLTRQYIERAYAGNYDICQGVVSPRTNYAVRPLGPFLVSHADDIRTHACLVYCSVFQGIFQRPLHVHGEGLMVTGSAERAVTWNWPAVCSEDLVFGQRAARQKLRWGWFHEYAEITSPWTLRDFLSQRRRWLWGDLQAIGNRKLMPPTAALRVSVKYLAGVAAFAGSVLGLWLRVTGRIPAGSPLYTYAKLSALCWAGVFFAAGWLGAANHDGDDSRMLSGTLAVLLMPVSAALTLAAIIIPLLQGPQKGFSVIAKTRRPA